MLPVTFSLFHYVAVDTHCLFMLPVTLNLSTLPVVAQGAVAVKGAVAGEWLPITSLLPDS
jgi:hypothetical protein